jgi:hypothetical protein
MRDLGVNEDISIPQVLSTSQDYFWNKYRLFIDRRRRWPVEQQIIHAPGHYAHVASRR